MFRGLRYTRLSWLFSQDVVARPNTRVSNALGVGYPQPAQLSVYASMTLVVSEAILVSSTIIASQQFELPPIITSDIKHLSIVFDPVSVIIHLIINAKLRINEKYMCFCEKVL